MADSGGTTATGVGGDGKRNYVPFLSALILIAYLLVMSFSVSGDWFRIDDARELSFVRKASSFWPLLGRDGFGLFRPVKNLLWLAFFHLSGWSIRWCHVFAITVGIASFFPVLALLRRILTDETRALAATSLWILSPTIVSSTAWLSGLNIQVMAAFSALSISCHDSAWDGGSFRWSRIALSSAFLFLALVSYESAIAVFPILLLFDALLRPGRMKSALSWTSHACHGSIVILYLAIRHLTTARNSMANGWAEATRLQLAASSPYFTVQHFASWFWPFGRFTVLGSYRWGDAAIWTLVACLLFGLAILVLAFVWRRQFPVLSFCILFALLAFAPTSNCLGFGNGPYGDYYLTLPSIGIAAGIVEAATLLLKTTGFWKTPAVAAVALFALSRLAAVPEAAHWASLWANSDSACMVSIQNFPRFFSNKYAIIRPLFRSGQYEEALQLGREIEEQVGPDSPAMGNVYLVRAIHALNVQKDADSAMRFLDLCGALHVSDIPNELLDYFRGCVYEDILDRTDDAIPFYERSLAEGDWTVELVPCADRLARIKAIRGELGAAIALWERASHLDPSNTVILWNLSQAYRESGNTIRFSEIQNRLREEANK